MISKKIIICFWFLVGFITLKAQKQPFQPIMYKLMVKELTEAPKYERSWGFSNAFMCQGNLITILSCLLSTEQGRLKIIGQLPKIYLDVELNEPSEQSLEEILGNQNAKKNNDMDKLSLVNSTVALLSKKYNFSVKNITDTVEVWCLITSDTTKLRRYDEIRDGNNRGAGVNSDDNTWEAVGMDIYYLCYHFADLEKRITYDETNLEGWFTFNKPTIPCKYMQNFDLINTFLEKNYGLRFIKRRQLEQLKLIEFR